MPAAQISLSGVQLMPGVLPYQENTGLFNSVTSKLSAFQVGTALNLHVILDWHSLGPAVHLVPMQRTH